MAVSGNFNLNTQFLQWTRRQKINSPKLYESEDRRRWGDWSDEATGGEFRVWSDEATDGEVESTLEIGYVGGKAANVKPNGLNKEYGPKLKEHMKYCIDHPEEMNKHARVQAQVSEVKGVVMENIEKVLDLGEKMVVLVEKTDNLRSQLYSLRHKISSSRARI